MSCNPTLMLTHKNTKNRNGLGIIFQDENAFLKQRNESDMIAI